jgi:murein DD-endopeptidase MepM/ murein hydrolase activator NlpD
VRQGEWVGTVGKTGNARHRWITPHLHLEVVKDGHPIDPQSLGLPIVDATTRPLALVAGADTHEQGGE